MFSLLRRNGENDSDVISLGTVFQDNMFSECKGKINVIKTVFNVAKHYFFSFIQQCFSNFIMPNNHKNHLGKFVFVETDSKRIHRNW